MRNLSGAVPQDAKTVNDAARVREMLRAGEKLRLRLRLLHIACHTMKEPERFAGAMKALWAFFGVSETSKGQRILRLNTISFKGGMSGIWSPRVALPLTVWLKFITRIWWTS